MSERLVEIEGQGGEENFYLPVRVPLYDYIAIRLLTALETK